MFFLPLFLIHNLRYFPCVGPCVDPWFMVAYILMIMHFETAVSRKVQMILKLIRIMSSLFWFVYTYAYKCCYLDPTMCILSLIETQTHRDILHIENNTVCVRKEYDTLRFCIQTIYDTFFCFVVREQNVQLLRLFSTPPLQIEISITISSSKK